MGKFGFMFTGFLFVAVLLTLLSALPLAFVSMLVTGALFPDLGWGFWHFYGLSFLLVLVANMLSRVQK